MMNTQRAVRRMRVYVPLSLLVCLGMLATLRSGTHSVAANAPDGSAPAPQATPTPAARGKINGKIAFVSNRRSRGLNIWTMNPDGSSPTRLSDETSRGPALPSFMPVYDSAPVWSPDGSKIAFGSFRDNKTAVYVMNADGSDVRMLVDDSVIPEVAPQAWSPDGTKLALVGGHPITVGAPGYLDIYVINSDGSNPVQLTRDTRYNSSPTWSPDGKRIAFSSDRVDGRLGIYVMNADGSDQRAIAARGWWPSWSPDGTKILFVNRQPGATSCDSLLCEQLYVVNPDGGELTQLTRDAGSYENPKWSPDGKQIVFTRNLVTVTVVNHPLFGGRGITERGRVIFVMNADGSNQTNISNREFGPGVIDVEPDWQPLLTPANQPPPSVLGFSASAYSAYEDARSIQLSITRSGNLNETVSCDYATEIEDGTIRVRRDYTLGFGTLRFAPGETSKTISVPIINPSYEGTILFIRLFNNQGNATFIGGNKAATVAILKRNAAPPSTNPIEDARIFVRMQYLDFLNREPDQAGWDYWTSQITKCGNDAKCINLQRVAVSAAFFIEQEFQQTGFFVYRFKLLNPQYSALNFLSFMRDVQTIRQEVKGTAEEQRARLEANKTAFVRQFFDEDRISASFGRTNAEYVDSLFRNARLTPTPAERDALVSGLDAGTLTRPAVFSSVLEDERFKRNAYNEAFVLMQYYGYLRRDPDDAGYQFWLGILNNREPNNYRAMVCAFITSKEYQERFGPQATRTNADCAP